ncbi:transposable element Tcb2 transposase [Trichonephila clavipes]|nr:transposable element Tcb2 transposase [Trichonephila clavipes]
MPAKFQVCRPSRTRDVSWTRDFVTRTIALGGRYLSHCSYKGYPRQTSRREDEYSHIVRNARVQPTASSAAIQAHIAPSLGAIQRRLTEGHLGSRRPLRVLPLMSTHLRLRLECCRARGNCTASEWNQVVFNEESRFNLSSDDNRVRVWKPRCERPNPAFALQRHTALTAGVMVWSVIAYNIPSPLVLIRGTMRAQRYVHDILQPHVLSLMQRVPGAIFQHDNARPHTARVSQACLRNVNTLPWPSRFRFVSNRANMGSFEYHEFERARGNITAIMERNVSIHHT